MSHGLLWLRIATRYLSVFQFLFLALSGALGYLAITRVQQALEDQKFLQSITGYISDLKPVVDIRCDLAITDTGDLVSKVTVVNSGKNVVRVIHLARQLKGRSDYSSLTPLDELYPTTENGMDMDIPPGRSVYTGDRYSHRGWSRDVADIDLFVIVETRTADAVMTVAKTILANRVPVDQLDDFAKSKTRCMSGPPVAVSAGYGAPPGP